MKLVSIVVPMYNEEEMVSLFFATINPILAQVKDYQFEIVAVNDGSKDKTFALLLEEQKKQSNLVVVNLSRNFGHEPAVCAGIKTAKGDAIIPIDADLQDAPEIIPDLIKKWEEGYDVVNARRASRVEDSFMKRWTAKKFYQYIAKLSGKVKVPQNVGHYRLISRRVADEVNALSEKNRVFRVQVPYIGFKTTEVFFTRKKRAGGHGHYNYHSMFDLAFNAIISSTIKPLYWPLKLTVGFGALFGLSVIAEIVLFVLSFNPASIFAEVNFGLWLIINAGAFFTLLLMFVLSIMAIYLAKTFVETQNRPFFLIEKVYEVK